MVVIENSSLDAHRDLKPSNILLSPTTPKGHFQVQIFDFGIARTQQSQLTRHEWGALGTAPYTPPEVFQSEQAPTISAQYDLFSWGVTLYRLISERFPFPAVRDEHSAIHQYQGPEYAPISLLKTQQGELSQNLLQLIHKTLRWSPQHRPPSARDMLKVLKGRNMPPPTKVFVDTNILATTPQTPKSPNSPGPARMPKMMGSSEHVVELGVSEELAVIHWNKNPTINAWRCIETHLKKVYAQHSKIAIMVVSVRGASPNSLMRKRFCAISRKYASASLG